MTAAPVTTPVREAHRFDEAALARYLERRLDGFAGPCAIRQFEGGQSNPTFLLETAGNAYVLRKKPPGKLLPSAHAVEREYRVMKALEHSSVPVCRMLLLCEDPAVIGTPFLVMEYAAGRVFHDLTLPGLSPSERTAVYAHMVEVLAHLHQVVPEEAGLADFGRPGNYYARQISRWTRQYRAAETRAVPAMDRLIDWLPANIPPDDGSGLVHGDYRLGNMILHPSEPRILALLDWELSTLGHPLADLAYNCMPYYMPAYRNPSLVDNDPAASGIPALEAYRGAYCKHTGRDGIDDWNFYMAFSLFRSAGIGQGVYKRGLDGNASSQTALQLGKGVETTAALGWRLAEESLSAHRTKR